MASLTRLIESREGSEVFKEAVVNPVPRERASMLFTPASLDTANTTVIGHAYDMWFRCAIARQSDNIDLDAKKFAGYEHSTSTPASHSEAALERMWQLAEQGYDGEEDIVDPIAENAAIAINKWIKGTGDEDSATRSCLTLGCFEVAYRSGHWLDPEMDMSSEFNELKKLIEVTDMDWIPPSERVTLNPRFMIMKGRNIIQADGDILVGQDLVELKTSRRRRFADDWRQLAGYVVLNDLLEESHEISQVSVYYARFGRKWSYPVEAIFNDEGREKITQYFETILSRKPVKLTSLRARTK